MKQCARISAAGEVQINKLTLGKALQRQMNTDTVNAKHLKAILIADSWYRVQLRKIYMPGEERPP